MLCYIVSERHTDNGLECLFVDFLIICCHCGLQLYMLFIWKYVACFQCARITVLGMVSATRPLNAVYAPDFGWKTSSWQTLANGRATVVTYLLYLNNKN